MNDAYLDRCLQLAVEGSGREYPHFAGPTLRSDDDLCPPRQLHPAFYGCFDWHSAVHAHWTMTRLVRLRPDLPSSRAAHARLCAHLTPEKLRRETTHFTEGTGFERPYGWAWALRLEAELGQTEGLADCAEAMQPLVDAILSLTHAYLPRLRWPVRAGTHANTAYALGHMYDWATLTDRISVRSELVGHATRLFGHDGGASMTLEPSGEDFLSPALVEADLMRRVLTSGAFADWLREFLPRIESSLPAPIADVQADDGRLGHLAGLNLSRAAVLRTIADTLPRGDGRVDALAASAASHLACGLGQVSSGAYEGEHWLGTFAVYALTHAGSDASG